MVFPLTYRLTNRENCLKTQQLETQMNGVHTMIMKTLKKGFTLVELLVVIAIIAILAATLLPVVAKAIEDAQMASMRDQGVGIYKALFAAETAGVFDEVSAFPTTASNYTSSTQFFEALITEKILDSDFSIFAGPGQKKERSADTTLFKGENNGWNIVLDVADASSMIPFLFSRNFLHADTTIPKQSTTSLEDKLGEPAANTGKLKFNTKAVIVVNKIGSGQILKKDNLKQAKNFNSTEDENTFLKPGSN